MLYKTNTIDPLDKKIYIDFGSPLRKDGATVETDVFL